TSDTPEEASRRPTEAVLAATPSGSLSDIRMPDETGTERNLGEWNGKPRLINFWATWCAPCLREIPLLKALQSEGSPPGLQVIGVAMDELEAVSTFAEQMQFNYPIVVGDQGALQIAERFDMDVMALPFTLIVSSQDELITAELGEIDETEAEEMLSVLTEYEQGLLTLEDARTLLAQ
ncbi:MAG: TlpA disulfide reductase family protein, partial [Pseudomonadota bacterium]